MNNWLVSVWTTVSITCCIVLGAQTVCADINIQMVDVAYSGRSDFNSVSSAYQIGQYEVTVGQYTEFLNYSAKTDPYGLYNEQMGMNGMGSAFIIRSGVDGDYSYSAAPGKEGQPVRYVSYGDGQRFCNWMQNGQGYGSIQNGSYDMERGAVARSAGCQWVLPTVSEWSMAAYYDAGSDSFYAFPNSSSVTPAEPTDSVSTREMNFGMDPWWNGFDGLYTSVGETTGHSPSGAYDMGGNVEEWTESTTLDQMQICMGGSFASRVNDLSAGTQISRDAGNEDAGNGFRVVYMVPEPVTTILLLCGLGFVFLLRAKLQDASWLGLQNLFCRQNADKPVRTVASKSCRSVGRPHAGNTIRRRRRRFGEGGFRGVAVSC